MPGRPGRKLQPSPDDSRSTEVVELVHRLIELIVRADSGWQEIADSIPRQTKQNLSYHVQTRTNGPDRLVVEQIVDFCCKKLDEPRGPLKAEFLRLREIADRGVPTSAAIGSGMPTEAEEAPPPPAVDPALVAPILQLVYMGQRHEAAQQLTAQYPEGGVELGQILTEIGSRTAAGVVDLIDAVIEEAGTARAETYLAALRDQDASVAAAVEAVPRTRPAPVPAAPTAEPTRPQTVLDEDPRKGDGRRRDALIRRGEVAQVAAEIINEAETGRATFSKRKVLDINLAGDLISNVLQDQGDDADILAILLSQLIEDGQAALATAILGRVHDNPENEPDVIQAVLQGMKRPSLQSALDHLAENDGSTDDPKGLLSLLLAQAPAPVTGAHLFKWELVRHPGTIEISELPHLQAVLRSMIERDVRATTHVLISQMETWNVETAFGAFRTKSPESTAAAAILGLAHADVTAAGRLLYNLLVVRPETASRLLFLLEAPRDEGDALGTVAQIVAAAIRQDPGLTPRLIARMVRHHDVPTQVLERVAHADEDHARRLARAMLVEDLPYCRTALRDLVRQGAHVLAGELLRQLGEQEPEGPWNLINRAIQDGATEAALANLDAYAPDQG